MLLSSTTHEIGCLLPSLPPVKYVPAWFPGATFQRIAQRSSELSYYIRNQPWKDVLERVRTRFGLLSCTFLRRVTT